MRVLNESRLRILKVPILLNVRTLMKLSISCDEIDKVLFLGHYDLN